MQEAFNAQTELQRKEVSKLKILERELEFRRRLWDNHDRRGGQPPPPGSCLVCGAQHALPDCQQVCLQQLGSACPASQKFSCVLTLACSH